MPSLPERWIALRNRLLASPRFHAAAQRFPLTRGIAGARARGLFDLVAGFVYAQVLAAAVELDLFAHLAGGPLTPEELAPRLRLGAAATARLLKATTALELTESVGGRVALGHRGATLTGNPGVLAMIAHHRLLYADLADPVALLRGEEGSLGAYWPYAGARDPAAVTPEQAAGYSRLMAASQPLVAAQLLGAWPLGRYRHLLDVGGGAGAFLIAAAARHPHLKLTLFDLPAVIPHARVALAAARVEAQTIGGSLFADALPRGADVATLIRILHDHDDTAGAAILARVRAALPPGGTLLIAEPMAGTGNGRVGDAYFGFYLLAMGQGRARTPAELIALCRAAGFARARPVRTASPLIASLVVART